MTDLNVSVAYELIQKISERAGIQPDQNLSNLASWAKKGRQGLDESFKLFQSSLDRVAAGLAARDGEEIAGAFVNLRVAAMGISTEFDNLVDVISVLFEKGVIGFPEGVGNE